MLKLDEPFREKDIFNNLFFNSSDLVKKLALGAESVNPNIFADPTLGKTKVKGSSTCPLTEKVLTPRNEKYIPPGKQSCILHN